MHLKLTNTKIINFLKIMYGKSLSTELLKQPQKPYLGKLKLEKYPL